MKLLIFLFLLPFTVLSQTDTSALHFQLEKSEIVEFCDVEAQFPGGIVGMNRFIQENMIYPQQAILNGEQGRVFISFVVEEDGELTDLIIDRGVSVLLDYETFRIVDIMPKWIPGEINGKAVRTRVRLPMIFRLD